MAVTSEFSAAINQICAERGIEPEKVYEALETAIASAYKKEAGNSELENISVEFDRSSGEFRILAEKEVVKKVEDKETQISLNQAKKIDDSIENGDVIEIEIPQGEFGRIAAQTAKQVILQQIRISEKEAVMTEFNDKVGQVFTAMMQRMHRGRAVFEIGKATAFMPVEEQIANEFYRVGQKYKVLLKEIREDDNGKTLIVSRADPAFLIELFRLEVPEIESGAIEVKACAREAGSRSKLAVVSHQEGIDPIGSCVGQRGVRIANVMNELGEEKIDIIEWAEKPEEFVANALSPAKVLSVEIKEMEIEVPVVDEDAEKNPDSDTTSDKNEGQVDVEDVETEFVMRMVAVVKVDEDQLSLAIGKDGQNVRLAHKLTGYKIDIQGPDGTKPPAPDKNDDDSDADDSDIGEDDSSDESDAEESAKNESGDAEESAEKESGDAEESAKNESGDAEEPAEKESGDESDDKIDDKKADESENSKKSKKSKKKSEKESKNDGNEEYDDQKDEVSEKDEKEGKKAETKQEED